MTTECAQAHQCLVDADHLRHRCSVFLYVGLVQGNPMPMSDHSRPVIHCNAHSLAQLETFYTKLTGVNGNVLHERFLYQTRPVVFDFISLPAAPQRTPSTPPSPALFLQVNLQPVEKYGGACHDKWHSNRCHQIWHLCTCPEMWHPTTMHETSTLLHGRYDHELVIWYPLLVTKSDAATLPNTASATQYSGVTLDYSSLSYPTLSYSSRNHSTLSHSTFSCYRL